MRTSDQMPTIQREHDTDRTRVKSAACVIRVWFELFWRFPRIERLYFTVSYRNSVLASKPNPAPATNITDRSRDHPAAGCGQHLSEASNNL